MAISPGGRPADDSPIGHGGDNWVTRAGGLPKYMREIAHALMRKGMPASRAIATAHEQLERLAAKSENPKVKAAAVAALAEWDAKRAGSHAVNLSSPVGSGVVTDSTGPVIGPVDIRDLIDLAVPAEDDTLDLAPGDYRAPYDWKHGFVPLTPAAVLSKAKKGPHAGKGRSKRPSAPNVPRPSKLAGSGRKPDAPAKPSSPAKPAGVDALANPGEARRRMAAALTDSELRTEAKRPGSKPETRAVAQAELDRRAKVRDDASRGRGVPGAVEAIPAKPAATKPPAAPARPRTNAEALAAEAAKRAENEKRLHTTDLREGDVIESRYGRYRIDKKHPDGTGVNGHTNAQVTNLDTGESHGMSFGPQDRHNVTSRGRTDASVTSLADRRAAKPAAREPGSSSRTPARAELERKAAAAGYDPKKLNGAGSDDLQAHVDAHEKGHPHPVGASVNATQPGIEHVTPGRVVGYTDNGMVKVQAHVDRNGSSPGPVGTFNPSHVTRAGQPAKVTPDSRTGKGPANPGRAADAGFGSEAGGDLKGMSNVDLLTHRHRHDNYVQGRAGNTASDADVARWKAKRDAADAEIAARRADGRMPAALPPRKPAASNGPTPDHAATPQPNKPGSVADRINQRTQADQAARVADAGGKAPGADPSPSRNTTSTNPNAPVRVEHTPDGTLVHGTDRSDAPALKAEGFKWSRNLDAWYLPRTWGESTRNQRVKRLEASMGDRVGVDRTTGPRKSAAEREAETRARAGDRATRMDDRAGKAQAEADRRFKAADLREEASGIPFGQPILVGHHSERRHRNAIEKAHANLGKGVEAQKAAEDASAAAERARATAAGTESKVTTGNRLKKLEAEHRAAERKLADDVKGREIHAKVDPGSMAGQIARQKFISPAYRQQLETRRAELVDEIAHNRAKLGDVPSKDTVKPGDVVHIGGHPHVVLKANAKSVTVPSIVGGSWTDTAPYHKITRHTPAGNLKPETLDKLAAEHPHEGVRKVLGKARDERKSAARQSANIEQARASDAQAAERRAKPSTPERQALTRGIENGLQAEREGHGAQAPAGASQAAWDRLTPDQRAKAAAAISRGVPVARAIDDARGATPANPVGTGRFLTPEKAGKMSDAQLEDALTRLSAGGASPATMRVIEDELDRRDRERAAGKAPRR